MKETEEEDEGEENFDEDGEDQFEAFGSGGRQMSSKNAWNEDGGVRRREVQGKLMKCFSLLLIEKGMAKKKKKYKGRNSRRGDDEYDDNYGDDDDEDDEEGDEDDEDEDGADSGEDDEDGDEPIYDHSGRVINKKYKKGLKAPEYVNQLRG